MTDAATQEDTYTLAGLGFLRPKIFHRDHWAALLQQGSFTFIVEGNREALRIGYQSRWAFRNLHDAAVSLHNWDGEGEPKGWLSRDVTQQMTVWP